MRQLMSKYKFQHWVPSCYLTNFALDPSKRRKNRRIFVTTSDGCIDKKIVRAGGKHWTYSKVNPELDQKFNEYENDYPNIADKLITGKKIQGKEKVTFILAAFDLHNRNIAYENRTIEERFHIYENVSREFMSLVIPQDNLSDSGGKEINYLSDNWSVATIRAGQSNKFITSDHPSIIFCDSNDEKPVICLLPLSSSSYAIIYKPNLFKVQEGQVKGDDSRLLNLIQAKRCICELYSDYNLFEEDDVVAIKKLLNYRKPDRYFDENGYKPDFIKITDKHFSDLSFISRP